ncbi:MAG TPA: M48 family metalloprotease [Bryobacteraceae bacterium]|nr:M48 family metalloprotease [Bryobacteraceae bacterium]
MIFLTPLRLCVVLAAIFTSALNAQQPDAVKRLLDRIVKQEQDFLQQLKTRTPLLETYIQESLSPSGDQASQRDHYFLGRLDLKSGLSYTPIVVRSDAQKRSRNWTLRRSAVSFEPTGFAQMMYVDAVSFNTETYRFEYVRREFLGGVRCVVFDVNPVNAKTGGKFVGRIWAEEQDSNIVRFNGTYTKGKGTDLYFHFDSWRTDIGDNRWVPAFTYVEESAGAEANGGLTFKAQTRVWGYNSGQAARVDELTKLLVEMEAPVNQTEAPADSSPLESQRSWERQSEENVLDRLERSGLLAPKGEVDAVLNTVINNLIVTNDLNIEARARVLLTTPLETFAIGRTIVISRGLIDVLPDEASLAMVLSDELAHVALAHRTDTQFAFHDQTMFSDHELLQRFRFSRSPEEIAAAGAKAVEILAKSPYKEKLSNAGLFLKAISTKASQFPNLIRANLGNQLADGATLTRMGALANGAPMLDELKLEQIPALPLGSRIKLDPWTDAIGLIKTKPVSLLSSREKLSFEIAPLSPHLTRVAKSTPMETDGR